MEIKGKRVIIIGERDGIPGPAIEAVIKSVGGEPILVQTQCFVWTSAGTLDPEGQEEIRSLMDKYDPEDMIVLLGSPTVESTEIFARTVTDGDPTWVGPLAGTSLKLPVYHILEPSIKEQIPAPIYDEQVGIMESVLDVDDLVQVVQKVRDTSGWYPTFRIKAP